MLDTVVKKSIFLGNIKSYHLHVCPAHAQLEHYVTTHEGTIQNPYVPGIPDPNRETFWDFKPHNQVGICRREQCNIFLNATTQRLNMSW